MDESIFAPYAQEKVYISEETLKVAKPNLLIIMGMASSKFRAIIESKGFSLKEYEGDDELMILRSRANAEGAVKIIMENTDFTIHKSNILLIGFGRTGQSLANLLIAMGANVLLAARNPVQRARAWEMGAVETIPLEKIMDHIAKMDIVLNSVPVRLLNEEAFRKSQPHTLYIDISAPPGGIDWELLAKVGRKGVWGRGLSGKRAPKTAGQSQYVGIKRILINEMGLKDS
jgi:dipicolinate synthase subunit A